MSYFVSKIGHLDPRFYSLIYCAIPGVQMSGSRCPTLFPKLDIWTPASTVLYTVQYRGSRCRGSRCRGSRCRGSRCRGSRCTPLITKNHLITDDGVLTTLTSHYHSSLDFTHLVTEKIYHVRSVTWDMGVM